MPRGSPAKWGRRLLVAGLALALSGIIALALVDLVMADSENLYP